MCACNNPSKELVLSRKVSLIQYLFETPGKTHCALPACAPAVEIDGSKIRAGLFAKFHPDGLQAADQEFTMETPTAS